MRRFGTVATKNIEEVLCDLKNKSREELIAYANTASIKELAEVSALGGYEAEINDGKIVDFYQL